MIKEKLKENEPIVYLTLKNDLQLEKTAHSYLFAGDANNFKIETAYLLAQSIIEGKNDFACEECTTCKRIINNNYFDLIFIDGYKSIIKKENIEYLIEQFSKTALEKANKKIYIITNINNSSVKVLNMILKFMEEPISNNIYCILISDDVENLLPTIVSRCKVINFKKHDNSSLIKEYVNKGYDYIDSYLLAKIKYPLLNEDENIIEIINKTKEYVYKTIDNLKKPSNIPLLLSKDFFELFKKNSQIKACIIYIQIMLAMIDDALVCFYSDDNIYTEKLIELSKYNLSKLFNIYVDALDKVNSNVNTKIVFDRIAAQIIM